MSLQYLVAATIKQERGTGRGYAHAMRMVMLQKEQRPAPDEDLRGSQSIPTTSALSGLGCNTIQRGYLALQRVSGSVNHQPTHCRLHG